MNRAPFILVGVGLLAAMLLWALGGSTAMTAYFAAWLFWIGVPMGALPIVAAMEAAGTTGSPLLPVLRPMLMLLPVGTVAGLPLLAGLAGLFARPGLPGALPQWWAAPFTLGLRDGVILVVLSLLALLFWIEPRRPRRRLGTLCLAITVCLGTVLAIDFILGPQPALGSSLAGLLLIAGQVALAATLAALLLAVGTDARDRLPDGTGLLLSLLVAFWFFLQFVQFLVVWSANLPAEAEWYLSRVAGIGTGLIAFIAIAAIAAIVLLPSVLGRIPVAVATLAAMAVLALLLTTLLFVLPAFRGRFLLTFSDALALVGIGGVLAGVLLLLAPGHRAEAQLDHA